MRPRDMEFNVEELILMKMPENNRYPKMAVSVTTEKFIRLNETLRKKLEEDTDELKMEIRVSRDCKIIVLRNGESESEKIKFHKDGKLRNVEFADQLIELGYALPARYIIEWNDKIQAWVGILEEVPELKDVSSVVKRAGKSRKKIG